MIVICLKFGALDHPSRHSGGVQFSQQRWVTS